LDRLHCVKTTRTFQKSIGSKRKAPKGHRTFLCQPPPYRAQANPFTNTWENPVGCHRRRPNPPGGRRGVGATGTVSYALHRRYNVMPGRIVYKCLALHLPGEWQHGAVLLERGSAGPLCVRNTHLRMGSQDPRVVTVMSERFGVYPGTPSTDLPREKIEPLYQSSVGQKSVLVGSIRNMCGIISNHPVRVVLELTKLKYVHFLGIMTTLTQVRSQRSSGQP
jgi:hypothetical protein